MNLTLAPSPFALRYRRACASISKPEADEPQRTALPFDTSGRTEIVTRVGSA